VGLPGADWLYLAMPHERDADAAATQLRVVMGIAAGEDDVLGSDRMLFNAYAAAPRASDAARPRTRSRVTVYLLGRVTP
jgi:hypothetical protein